jgi:hypothetical protein
MNNQDHLYASTLWKRWELYSATQKEAILEEFRRRWPDDHFDKQQLVQFLHEKYDQDLSKTVEILTPE